MIIIIFPEENSQEELILLMEVSQGPGFDFKGCSK